MKKILAGLMALVLSFSAMAAPVMAEGDNDKGVPTAILDTCGRADDGIACILNLVVNIMTIGIGVLGVLGITIVGVQYLTAGDNEEKTRKAKRRMFEIVIGLVAYVAVYALLSWLIPDFNPIIK